MRVDAVIVAGGESRRMAGVDKLVAPLLGRPVLAWSIEAVAGPDIDRIIVVAPGERLAWLSAEPLLRDRIEIRPAGPRRQESVAAGVQATSAPLVLVHDGARPLATPHLAARVALAAGRFGAAIPVVPVVETVKRLGRGRHLDGRRVAGTVPRESLALAQTPQGFRRELLEGAWSERPPDGRATWSDEAALLEEVGVAVHAIPGESTNLKVTVPEDLGRAASILAARLGEIGPAAASWRTGFGQDSHPFGPEWGMALGGIHIAEAPALLGHSDGDVALHAVADALLGAAALGDLGRLYPAAEPSTAGIASSRLLGDVIALLGRSGFEPRGVDVTIVGARPHLGSSRLEAMRATIAKVLGLPLEQVSVKASSGNLGGDEGAGRMLSARAVATIQRRGAP